MWTSEFRAFLRSARSLLVVALVAVGFSPCERAVGQEINATLTGSVTDAQGSSVPGVIVTVSNVGTNVSVETVTDAHGGFRVQNLQPGPYRVSAALQGFKSYVREGIVLRTAETASLNIQLALGAIEETLSVSADLTAVETNQSTLAQTMGNKQISELPLNGRQVYMLLQQTAGTIFTQTQFGAQGFSGTRAWDVNGSVTIHGSRTGNNEFLIDGAAISGTGGWSYAPPVDAIEEFKVQTASTDASYGRTSGGVVNLRLRSGTNDLRGSLTLLARGTALDSNTIQNINNNISNEGHKYANLEGMLAGPLQKDRTFFMIGYQGFYEDIPFPATATVATELQRAGDFSQTLNGAGQLITIFDPQTTRPDPARPGRFIRDAFPGNRIPVNRINPVAAALLQHIPRANASGSVTGANNLINSPNLGHYRYNSYLTRIDHRFSAGHRLSLTNSGNWGSEKRSENGLPPGPALRSDNWPTQRKSYILSFDDVITLKSGTLINTRVSFDRFDEPHAKEFGPLRGTTLPFTTPYQVTSEPWYPHVTTAGYTELFGRPDRLTRNDIYSATSSLSKTLGKHFVKAGAEARLYRLARNDFNDANGLFNFTQGFTQRDPQTGDQTSGNGFASFLLGYPANGSVDISAASVRNYGYYSVYVQDEWKIDAKATLSLGLRWDHQAPVTEKNDQLVVGFDTTTPSPLQVPGLALRGGLRYARVDGSSGSPYSGDWDNIQPRASFSYKISERVSARANYGRSFFPLTGCCGGVIQTGYSQSTSMTASEPGLFRPLNTLTNPFPAGFLQPLGSSQGLLTGVGTGISFVNPEFEVPHSDQWAVGVNLELPWKMGLDLAYVGNRVRGLPVSTSINEVPRAEREKAIEALGGNASYLSTAVTNPFAGRVNPALALNNATVNRSQLLRPYPQFNGITRTMDNNGRSRYKALEAVLTKRLSRGVSGAVNYTLSRTSEATDYLNNGYEAQPFEDLAGVDRTHHFTFNVLYQLPFKGNRLVEGWQFNVLYEWMSGTPTAMPNGILRQDSARIPKSEQCVGNTPGCRWFDNSTINNRRADGGYAWETLPPNAFRVAPFRMTDVRDGSIENVAISVFKNTRIGGNKTLQLRAELFSPFNTRYYGGPNTGITNTNFGQITQSQFNFPRTGQLGLRFTF